jgi:1,4-alpha-glucan branching enzyme
VPSRVDNLQTYEGIFSKSFNASFFLSPPVMYSTNANDFFGSEFFVMTTDAEIRENFLEFARAIEQLGENEITQANNAGAKQSPFHHKVNGSILDRFRAVRNSTDAANDQSHLHNPQPTTASKRIKSVIPSFLMMRRDG